MCDQSKQANKPAVEAVLCNAHLLGMIIQRLVSQPENGQSLANSSTQLLSQLAQLRQLSHLWKRSIDHFLVNCLKALTLEVDFLIERQMVSYDLPRRNAYISFHEAANAGQLMADDFQCISETLQSRRRPSQVYEVLSGGPLLRLAGPKLLGFVNFLKALSGGNGNAKVAPKPMALEALSLVIREQNGSSALVAMSSLPTIEALLGQFSQLKHLSLNFDIARYKGWHARDSLQRWTVQYLVDSRLASPLTSLDLNFHDLFADDRKDFGGLAPLMPQLTGHFGLNAETATSVLPTLLAGASNQLKSLKINTTNCKVEHLLDDDGEEHKQEHEGEDDRKLKFNRAILQSVSSLTLINNTKCKEMEEDGIKVRALLLRNFTNLSSLVLAEQDGTWDYQVGLASSFTVEQFAMLARLHSLTRLTLIGFSLSEVQPQDMIILSGLTELTMVGYAHFLRPFYDHLRQQWDFSRLVKAAFTQPMPSLQAITLFGIFSRVETVYNLEERIREELAQNKKLRRIQLYFKAAQL